MAAACGIVADAKRQSWPYRGSLLQLAIAIAVCFSLALPPPTPASAAPRVGFSEAEIAESSRSDCQLNSARGDIQHVIYIHFGHLHFTRDNPNVPSDLEQMPHLLDFIERNGTLLTNHHTLLPSDSMEDALTALTGVYPEHSGQTSGNKHAFAPWVTFTGAGCNVGAVALPGMTLQNIGSDVLRTFGANSLEAALSADPSTAKQAAAALEGLAIHCASANSACAYGVPDLLADEPRYAGFSALFGQRNVAPVISANAPLTDLSGQVIADAAGNAGFPGFTAITAAQSLAYVAAMQEHGVPVTYAYISSAQRNHLGSASVGPGEAGYVAQLKADDDAVEKFFARLAADGINQNNTLFVVTADEGGRFVDGAPTPTTCEASNVPCTYLNLGPMPTHPEPELWNHGGLAPELNTTFLGFVGPGITTKGRASEVWSDHADIRATMLALLGLKDDSPSQGRVLTELFHEWALPVGVRDGGDEFLQLAQAYKKISAPSGELDLTTLQISAAALAADDAKHVNLERQLGVIAVLRDDLASAMANLLDAAEFRGHRISQDEARQLVRSANDLVDYVKLVAANGW